MRAFRNIVLLPFELADSDYVGNVFGFFHDKTKVYNIVGWGDAQSVQERFPSAKLLGRLVKSPEIFPCDALLLGVRSDSGISFQVGGVPFGWEGYSLVQDIFSRNTGILETDWMLDKTAFIIGCGSVGSFVALELARSGVGNFVLVDNDLLNFHNVCRHQCDISDVGNLKVDALAHRIWRINPNAKIVSYAGIIEDMTKEMFDVHCRPGSLIIGCGDNRESDRYACQIAAIYSVPFVSIGFWERAFAGEIFYYAPGLNMPCYECAIGGLDGLSERTVMSRRFYTTEEDLERLNFEPGIAVDIDFVTLIGVKISLDLLNSGNPKFTTRLIDHLSQFTLVCNTNKEKVGGEHALIFSYPLQVTTSIHPMFVGTCPPCKYE